MTAKLILLCAGGTGGHMFPARALAEELLARGYRVALACDTRGRKYFDGLKGVDVYVLASGTYRPGILGKLKFLWPLVTGYFQAHKLIGRIKPSVCVGFGGYPSAPPLWAAQHRGLPTVLHEQNAILGLANVLLIRRAKKLALSWSGTRGIKSAFQSKTIVTGNPVRAEITALGDQPYQPPTDEINLLVVGGSQGAAVFNDILPQAFTALPPEIRNRLKIVQQVRADSLERVRAYYASHGMHPECEVFFADMPDRLRVAHMLITRSGASTVAELAVAGRPALYVPYPWNRDHQQTFNAEAVTQVGGGWLIEERDLTLEDLNTLFMHIFRDPQTLNAAAAATRSIGKPDAARQLADVVIGFC